jgi:hypothetical protein
MTVFHEPNIQNTNFDYIKALSNVAPTPQVATMPQLVTTLMGSKRRRARSGDMEDSDWWIGTWIGVEDSAKDRDAREYWLSTYGYCELTEEREAGKFAAWLALHPNGTDSESESESEPEMPDYKWTECSHCDEMNKCEWWGGCYTCGMCI